MSTMNKGRILAEALPYIRAYHGKTLVIRFGGEAMTDPALKAGFARDVALLRLVGMKPDRRARRRLAHRRTAAADGHRGAPARPACASPTSATLNVVEMVLGELNQELVGLINRHGGAPSDSTGRTGASSTRGACAARRRRREPRARPGLRRRRREHRHRRRSTCCCRATSFRSSCRSASAPTAPRITSTPTCSPDELARALTAEKLILMTNVAGRARSRRQARLHPDRERGRSAAARRRRCRAAWCRA